MELLLALAAATAVLVAIPGPNVALIVANSLAFGLRDGVLTVAGTTLGVTLQLVLVVAGMSVMLELASEAFSWLRWIGVAYLVWLGIRTYRSAPADLTHVEARRGLLQKSCFVAAVNPKTLLFNAAFLPQFVPPAATAVDVALVGGVFLAVLFAGDLLWAVFAHSAKPYLARAGVATNRIAGGFLVLAGVGLALARRGG